MACIRILNHVLCFTKDVDVEDAILNYIFDKSGYLHDDGAVIDTKTIVDQVTSEYMQFSRADVVRGIVKLVHRGRLIEKFPNEYVINEQWKPKKGE